MWLDEGFISPLLSVGGSLSTLNLFAHYFVLRSRTPFTLAKLAVRNKCCLKAVQRRAKIIAAVLHSYPSQAPQKIVLTQEP